MGAAVAAQGSATIWKAIDIGGDAGGLFSSTAFLKHKVIIDGWVQQILRDPHSNASHVLLVRIKCLAADPSVKDEWERIGGGTEAGAGGAGAPVGGCDGCGSVVCNDYARKVAAQLDAIIAGTTSDYRPPVSGASGGIPVRVGVDIPVSASSFAVGGISIYVILLGVVVLYFLLRKRG